jgi:hypothetical protein
MSTPIQEQPESTIGRKPPSPPAQPHRDPVEHESSRSGSAIGREEGHDSEPAARERERAEPPSGRGREE